MYINTGYSITNTPSNFTAGYNTWPYLPPKKDWYQAQPYYYTDQNGQIHSWNHWNPPKLAKVPGGTYKGTPTRTGGFYAQNTIVSPTGEQNYGYLCMP